MIKESVRVRPIMPAGGAGVQQRWRSAACHSRLDPADQRHLPLHSRPDLYPDPTLSAGRFLGKRIDPYQWMPFGGGVRRCLGMAFALFEMKVVVATVLMKARLRIERPDGAVEPARVFSCARRWAAGRRRRLTPRPSSGRGERVGLICSG